GLRPAADPDALGRGLLVAGRRLVKSIRLSLMIYFLALLGLALGAVSVLAYRTAQETLTARKKDATELIQARFDKSCQDEHDKLDAALLEQAERFAGIVQVEGNPQGWSTANFQQKWGSLPRPNLAALGTLSAVLSPVGYATALPWITQATDRPFKL